MSLTKWEEKIVTTIISGKDHLKELIFTVMKMSILSTIGLGNHQLTLIKMVLAIQMATTRRKGFNNIISMIEDLQT